MIIQNITLNNYRLYEGVNKISFEFDAERNVHLICGENGFGKTTFLHSLLWCLYGRFVGDVPAAGQDVGGNYATILRNNLNINASKRCEASATPEIVTLIKKYGYTNELEYVKKDSVYSVTIRFTELAIPAIPCSTIDVVRSYDAILQKEQVEIMIDGNRNELTEEIGPDVFINDFILNKDIARLFFFDSEEVVELAETGTIAERRRLSRAYEEVLGIRKYEDLKSNLEGLRMRYRKKSRDIGLSQELEKLLKQKEFADQEAQEIGGHIQKLNDTLVKLREEDIQLQAQLSREGSSVKSEEMNRLKLLIETCKKNDAEMKSRLKQFIDYAPFAIAGKVFAQGYELAKMDYETISNNNASVAQNHVLDSIGKDLMKLLSALPVDNINKKNAETKLADILEKYRGNKSNREVQMTLSEDDFAEIESVYNSITTTYRIEFEVLAESYRKNKVALERNTRRLSNMQSKESDEVVKKLRAKKNQVEASILETDVEIRLCHEKAGASNIKLAQLEKQIKDLSKRVSVDAADEKKDVLANQLVGELETFLFSLKQNKKSSLERRIRTTLNSLMHKEYFIGRVEVVLDSDAMDILLYTPNDDLIDKDTLSKGEKQLYATSLLKSLVDESGIQFPVFIDSPLQKFDKSHSSKIISEFYPSISRQVVLFPLLHKELTKPEYDMLLPYIGSTTLITNDTTRSGFKTVDAATLLDEN
ncbi:AAA family ATPase [Phocaeicola sartorii]|uniref:AAA family ATPase n=1 Tax=Phocaeicola sartorii TaxID=671267 RepID=UPI0025997232|nr:AAA family ATPase [Phocaeicola sartorii]